MVSAPTSLNLSPICNLGKIVYKRGCTEMESNSTIKCHLRYMPLGVIVVFIAYTNSVPLSWKAQLLRFIRGMVCSIFR